jgi:MFS superfamily sulfate permease-like transporter
VASVLAPSLRGYRRAWLGRDVVAGLTVWAVLVPEALAYATIAGVSPVVGLYAAPPALVFYALFGSSRHLVVGPMSATAALSATAVADVATGGDVTELAAALAVITGVIALVGGLIRLGFVSNFISEPVLKGFIIGMALVIVIGQVPKLFGVEPGDGNFFEKLWDLLAHLGDTSITTLVVGLASLAVVLGLRRFAPRVPGSLVAVAGGVVAVADGSLDPTASPSSGRSTRGSRRSGCPTCPPATTAASPARPSA